MPQDIKPEESQAEQKPLVTPESAVESSDQDVKNEAEHTKSRIITDVSGFRAEEGVEHPDLVIAADREATSSQRKIDIILTDATEEPVSPVSIERPNFDYSGASDWLELFSQIGQNMSQADADFVADSIKSFREGKISIDELPVTPDSHLKEVALRLHEIDLMQQEKPSEPMTEKSTVSSKDLNVNAVADVESAKESIETEPIVLDNRHDVRDAKTKGSINRLKALLDEINTAIQKSDRTLQQRSLEQAAILLNEPRFAAQSTELPLVLEQAQISAEAKIKALETEIQVSKMERLIVPLKDLINKINSAKTREDKLSVLQEAAKLLDKPDLSTAILQKSKEEQDLLVPDALEQAVLLAEAKIRKIEEEINKLKNSTETETVPVAEPAKSEDTKTETPEPVATKPEKNSESEKKSVTAERTPEQVAELADARAKYFELVKKNKTIFSKSRNFFIGKYKEGDQGELEQAHDQYEGLKQSQIEQLLEAMKAAGETDPEKLVAAYIQFLKNEEGSVDNLIASGDKTAALKFKGWWNRHAKARLALGAGLFAVGLGTTVASGGLLGGLASAVSSSVFASTGFAAARGVSSGTGTYMGLESVMDSKSKKIGQKGLIDEVEGHDFYKHYKKKKEGDKVTFEETDKSKEKRFALQTNLREKSIEELGRELARLRTIGIEKNVGVSEAGRYGRAQAVVVEILEGIYYDKLKAKVLEESKTRSDKDKKKEDTAATPDDSPEGVEKQKLEKADRLLDVLRLKGEDERADQLLSEVGKRRKNSMIRHGVAATLGVSMGIFSGVMAEKMMAAHAAKEAAAEAAVAAQDVAQQAAEQTAHHVSYVMEVKPGDSLWDMIGDKLHEAMGDEKWAALGEAGRTHAIDQIKDAVGAHPESFGIHDIDKLVPGQHIDLTSLLDHPGAIEHVQEGVQAMYAAGGEANILANNDALEAAAKAGVHLTTENVNAVAAEVRNFGTGFLSPDGSIHEWVLNGHAVDRLADGSFALADSHQVVSPDQLANVLNHAKETAQHLVDTETAAKTAAELAATQAAEQAKAAAEVATEAVAQQQVETFLNQGGTYNHGLFEAARDLGQVDQLVVKIIGSGNQEQITALVHDYATNHGWSENKAAIFISALRNGDKIDFSAAGTDMNNPGVIAENMKIFESTALDTFDKVKHMPAGHWFHARLGDTYALVQKYHTSFWPFRVDHFMMDMNGDHKVDGLHLDSEAMKESFAKGAEAAKRLAREIANRPPTGHRPEPM